MQGQVFVLYPNEGRLPQDGHSGAAGAAGTRTARHFFCNVSGICLRKLQSSLDWLMWVFQSGTELTFEGGGVHPNGLVHWPGAPCGSMLSILDIEKSGPLRPTTQGIWRELTLPAMNRH